MCLDEFCFPRQISVLPLVTTFCQGQGQQYWAEGKVGFFSSPKPLGSQGELIGWP